MRRDEFEKKVRRLVLLSADAMPEKVLSYIKRIGRDGGYNATKEVLSQYQPLVDHLATDYVDFVLDYLFVKEDKQGRPSGYSTTYSQKYGIIDNTDYFPPSHIQGPFLYLLRKNEDEGLRLIHTLTNSATAAWRAQQEASNFMRPGRRPLPVTIDLPSGPRDLWGNGQVYSWFRPLYNAPHALTSALMALEVWMEEQVESGRDAEELFAKVLGMSDCVAVAGVSLGIALAYPDICLEAALPIVSAPALWNMDIARYAADFGTSATYEMGMTRFMYEVVEARFKRPQRKREVRSLAHHYMTSRNEPLQTAFVQAVARFTERLPFAYEDQQDDPAAAASIRENMENFQVYGDIENYRQRRVGDQFEVWVELPEHIKERNQAKLAPTTERQSWFQLKSLTAEVIKAGKLADGMAAVQLIAAARTIHRPEDFSTPFDKDDISETVRLQAIAGAAAAILITSLDWARAEGHFQWCLDILLATARVPVQEDELVERHSRNTFDPKISAALGLGAVIASGEFHSDVRDQLIRLVADPNMEVVGAVFRGIRNAWRVDEALCWNALSLGISLCLEPSRLRIFEYEGEFGEKPIEDGDQWVEELVTIHLGNIKQNMISEPPRVPISNDVIFAWDLAIRTLCSLPLSSLIEKPLDREMLLDLVDSLMVWTVVENTPPEGGSHWSRANIPYEWNKFFLEWASGFGAHLSRDETRTHIIAPVQAAWPKAPQLTADLLFSYIKNHLAYLEPLTDKAQNEWRELCGWVLDRPELSAVTGSRYLLNGISDAISLIVYVFHGESVFNPEWSHAALFADVINRWVEVICRYPETYSDLIVMLGGPGWVFAPGRSLEWMHRCVQRSRDKDELWVERSNGERTAELLQRIWEAFEDRIRGDKATLRQYAELIDALVIAGIPLASLLQDRLEKRAS